MEVADILGSGGHMTSFSSLQVYLLPFFLLCSEVDINARHQWVLLPCGFPMGLTRGSKDRGKKGEG